MNEMNLQTRAFRQEDATPRHYAIRKEAREAFKTAVADFRRRLQNRHTKTTGEDLKSISEDAESLTEIASTAHASLRMPKYSRRLLLPTNQHLDIQDIQSVNKLYHVEGEALDRAQRATFSAMSQLLNDSIFPTTFTGREMIEHFQCVYDMMRRTTDRVTKFNGLTASPDTTDIAGNLACQDDELLLDDFFQICPVPNLAEILMLSTICRNHPFGIWSWFEAKRKESWKFFHTMVNLKGKRKGSGGLQSEGQNNGQTRR